MERRWDYRKPDQQEDAVPAELPASPRRWWLVVVGVLLAAVAVVTGRAFWVASPRPEAPATPASEQPHLLTAPPRTEPAHPFPDAPPTLPFGEGPAPPTYEKAREEALAMSSRLMERFPNAPEAVSLRAWMHHRFRDTAKATQCWRRWLEHHPNFAEAYFRLGFYAKDKGNDEEALGFLQKAFELAPEFPGVRVHLGETLMNLGKMEEALAVLEVEPAAGKASPNRFLALGHAYLQTQQPDKAKEAFGKAVELDPSLTHAYYGLARACTLLGEAEEARRHMDDFQERHAHDESAHRADLRQGNLDSIHLILADWYTVAGIVYQREGDLGQAEAHWLRAAAIEPRATESRRALAALYRRQGRIDRAAQVAAELREIASIEGN